MKTNHSVFNKVQSSTLKLMAHMNVNKLPNFVMPCKYISNEAGKLGWLLSDIACTVLNNKQKYKSFFCNSGNEALQAAIKIIRHNGSDFYDQYAGRILIHSSLPNSHMLFFTDNSRFYPNITFINNLDNLKKKIELEPSLAIIFTVLNPMELDKIQAFLDGLEIKPLFLALDLSLVSIPTLHKFRIKKTDFELIIWGEELTNRQVPFGAMTMSNTLFKKWNTMDNCLLHSTTYGGNLLSVNKSLAHLLSHYKGHVDSDFNNYHKSQTNINRIKYFSDYVNPKLTKLYKSIGYDFEVKKADGCYLTVIINGKEYCLFDCIGGGGLSIFGHNPSDLVDSVIRTHNVDTDYISLLTIKLRKLIGLEVFFPSVSGASAVEGAIILGLSAQPISRRKILVFDKNYSGKLLLPLIASTSLPQDHNNFFKPHYHEVVTMDPFDENAELNLKSILKEGGIGLIWFEYVRGHDGKKVPDKIINIICENRKKYNYFIGIDEVLCGMCRTGPILSASSTSLNPDIVTLSKGLTYMTFPIGGTLVSSDIRNKASFNSREMVRHLETRYRNQIGAHIALHCLERIETNHISNNVRFIAQQLSDNKSIRNDQLQIEYQHGLFFKLCINKPFWMKLGFLEKLFYQCWARKSTKYYLQKKGILLYSGMRMLPMLAMTKQHCMDLIQRLVK